MRNSNKNTNNRFFVLGVLFLIFLILVTLFFILKEIKPMLPPVKTKIIQPFKKAIIQPFVKPPPIKPPVVKEEKGHGEIAFDIDDAGWNTEIIGAVKKLQPYPVTVAVIPDTPYGVYDAKALSKMPNCQVIMHLPLEPDNPRDMTGLKFLTINMSAKQIKHRFDGFYKELGRYIVGVNNHEGSLFTSNKEKMKELLMDLKSKNKNLFFLDSMTSPYSVVGTEAEKLGVKTAKRDVFLDDNTSYNSVVQSIEETKQVALEDGHAIAIGHVLPETLAALEQQVPLIAQEGYKLVFVSQLVH
ncbi:MAG: divergent polysaccharide deacetylase family protein [Candidatus Omnitrophica bacterium]|nr:divergent polysaccharide deacetylase family protein [Candidatus Omnitrophota bacterium]